MAQSQGKPQKGAVQVGADAVRNARALSDIAKNVASGNYVGAAVKALSNPQLLKGIACLLLAFFMLICCCLFAVPSMIWEAAQAIATSIYVSFETATEAVSDSIYYVLYGSGDGHEGLTPILEGLGTVINPLGMIANMAVAGWEWFIHGEISDETMDGLPTVVQGILDSVYGGDSGEEEYLGEAYESSELEADSVDLMEAHNESGGALSWGAGEAKSVAMDNKYSATVRRVGGMKDDLEANANKDAIYKQGAMGCDRVTIDKIEFPSTKEVAKLLLAFYTVQTGASPEASTLAEYCNWLGMSKQSWTDRGPFVDRYAYIPDGDWDVEFQHWGGEVLPQDVYREYDYLADAAVMVEAQKDVNFTANDTYDVRQEVLNGKYKMDSEYSYPDACTEDAYKTNYSEVWYNSYKDKYYDRGALDIFLYPDETINYWIETVTVGIATIYILHLEYKFNTLELDGEWWNEESQDILYNTLQLDEFTPADIGLGSDDSSDADIEGGAAAGDNTNPESVPDEESNPEPEENPDGESSTAPTDGAGTGEDDSGSTAEYVIEPRAVLLNEPQGGRESKTPTLNIYGSASNPSPSSIYEVQYFRDLVQTLIVDSIFDNVFDGIFSGGGGDIVQVAASQIGTTETGPNDVLYTQWYPMVGAPWCAMFISWCADQCGYLESGLIPKTAHSATFWNYVQANPEKGMLYTPEAVRTGAVTPQAGDILIVSGYNNAEATSTSQRADDSASGTRHVALVTGYDPATGTIATIDGNISDRVDENTYNITTGDSSGRKIFGFVRPAYPASAEGIEGGVSHEVSGLDMDTDGSSDPADQKDPYYQATTSITTADGKYYDASKVNYVVVAKGSTELLGCLATIYDHQTGKTIACVAADSGPREDDWNEVSVCAGRSLGYNVSGNVGVSTDKKFTITYYPDCKLTLYAEGHGDINSQITAQATAYKTSQGGSDYNPNFGANNESGRVD